MYDFLFQWLTRSQLKAGPMCQLSSLKTSPGLVSLPGSVQLLHKIMNAKTVEAVGINRFKILVTGNIDMWRHPKYYKELRKLRNKLDQAISKEPATAGNQRSPGPGLKLPGPRPISNANKGLIHRRQATSSQASSDKPQAPSNKRQAPSRKLQADES